MWTSPPAVAGKLLPGNRKIFRVKGSMDGMPIKQVALFPVGNGNFILPVNGPMRKQLGKGRGEEVAVSLEHDPGIPELDADLLACLEEEPKALEHFNSLPRSHRNYFSNWIASAKTDPTRTKRIARAITALLAKQDYGQMMRANKGK